jgi:hypothetical protein
MKGAHPENLIAHRELATGTVVAAIAHLPAKVDRGTGREQVCAQGLGVGDDRLELELVMHA